MLKISTYLMKIFLTFSMLKLIYTDIEEFGVLNQLKRNLNQTESKNFSNLLNIHGPFSEEDYLEMKDQADSVFSLLADSIFPSKNNTIHDKNLKNFLNPRIRTSKDSNHTDSFICKTCLYSLTKFHNLIDKKYGLTLFNQFLSLFCAIGLDYKICKDAIFLYSPTIIDSLIEHYLDAEYICTKTKICKFSHYDELDPDEYAKELLSDKPAKKSQKIDDESPVWKVLHVTDIHTDLLYEEVN